MDLVNEIDLSSHRQCGVVCFVKSPHNFWIRLDEFKTELIEMTDKLQTEYENASNEDALNVKNLKLGSLYCIFNQKSFEWQRCEVLRINQNEISIFYIDSGETDLVSADSIRPLKDYFKSIKRFALNCSFDDLKPSSENVWKQAVINQFSTLVLNKRVTLILKSKINQSSVVYNVDMFLKTQNIAEWLIDQGHAKSTITLDNDNGEQHRLKLKNHKQDVFTMRFIKAAEIPLNDQFVEIEITCIYSPFCFYAQLKHFKEDFSRFEESIQTFYENEMKHSDIVLLKKPCVGQMCIARYSVDDFWYRAVVKEIDLTLNSVVVFFIDYGNHDTVQIDGNLLAINEQFIKYPCLGTLCCLDGIKPISGSNKTDTLMEESINLMFEIMSFKVMAKFIDKQAECYQVEVQVEELVNEKSKMVDLSEKLIQMNYVASNGKTKPAARLKSSVVENNGFKVNNKPATTTNLQSTLKKYIPTDLGLGLKKAYDITITHVESVNEFYFQLNQANKEKDMFRPLCADIQYFYEKKTNLPQPNFECNTACIYYDDEKNVYHRAQIVNVVDKNNCIIYLIDIGQKKLVNRTQLREIYEKYLNICPQALQGSLEDLRNLQNAHQTDEGFQAKFKKILLGKTFLANVLDITSIENDEILKNKYLVKLYDSQNEEVFALLIEDLDHELIDQSFKPSVKSKLEETRLDETLTTHNQSVSLINPRPAFKFNNNNNHDQRQASIHDDITSPFPVHETNHNNFDTTDNADGRRLISKTKQTLIETADKLKQLEENKKAAPMISYYDTIEIDPLQLYNIIISNYEKSTSFNVQFIDLFLDFDQNFDEFQLSCSQSKQIDCETFKTVKNFDTVSIAAKFYDDSLWYRARLLSMDTLETDGKCLIEFIDYGNCQLTLLTDCVYLNEKFAKFKPCSIKCLGIAYLNKQVTIDSVQIENLLSHGKPVKESTDETKMEWNCYLVKQQQQNNDNYFIQIDEIYNLVYKYKLVDSTYLFQPFEFNEPIIKQNVLQIDTFFDCIVSDIKNGLQFIYVQVKQSLDELKRLENQLANESVESLYKLNIQNLKINNFYLINYNKRMYRGLLLTPISNNAEHDFQQLHLIDYGNKLSFSSRQEMEDKCDFFVLTPKYFKYNSFAIHCQLPLPTKIEKVWVKEEKEKFYHSIQPQKEFQIKLLSTEEPYVIEFKEDPKKIDFQFNSIITRVNQLSADLEPQHILSGNNSMSLMNDFKLGGTWLLKKEATNYEFNVFFEEQSIKSIRFQKFFVYSKQLLEKNKFQHQNLEKNLSAVHVENVKENCIYFVKCKSQTFLSSLKDHVRLMIENYFSRVKIINKPAANQFTLFYLDYGLIDLFQASNLSDYEFYSINIHSKILPTLTIECILSPDKLAKKLMKAKDKNDFIDAFYLNSVASRMLTSLKSFKVDFTEYFKQLHQKSTTSNLFTVDLIDPTDNQSIIDKIIDLGLKEIASHSFLSIITHFTNVKSFYVQKFDQENTRLLDDLQLTIQKKIAANQLQPLLKPVLNKLCISFYNDDEQYYRAKIISFNEIECEVFYIDFGNSSKVKLNQIKEITPDLIERLPKAFSISCELDLTQSNFKTNDDIEDLNKYIGEIAIDDLKFNVKFISRKENKYNDTACYIIQMYESETKLSIIDHFKKFKRTETSNVNFRFDNNSSIDTSSEDDRALAENLTDTSSKFIDDTNNVENTLASVTSKSYMLHNQTEINHLDPDWNEPGGKKISQSVLTKNNESANHDPSWTETPSHLKHYVQNETTINTTFNTTTNTTINNSNKNYDVVDKSSSWSETPLSKKNYVHNETTLNESICSQANTKSYSEKSLLIINPANKLGTSTTQANSTLNDSQIETYENNELYKTAISDNSQRFESNDSTASDTDATLENVEATNLNFSNKEEVLIKSCLISYFNAISSFYIQTQDFEQSIAGIQPEIDECFDPFDESVSSLCVGKFSDCNGDIYYRLRLLDWQGDNTHAKCVLIDYGNVELILKDEITAMSENLKKVKPLAIHCCLYTNKADKPNCFHNLEELVNSEMLFDVIIQSKTKLNEFYNLQLNGRSSEEFKPINVRLYLMDRKDFEINEMTLDQEYPTFLNYIKNEPLSILISDDQIKHRNGKNCVDYSDKIRHDYNDDDEDDNNDHSKRDNIYSDESQRTLTDETVNYQRESNNSNHSYNGGKNTKNHSHDANQTEIDNFLRENETDCLESNKPEAYMYKKKIIDSSAFSELPSLVANTHESSINDNESLNSSKNCPVNESVTKFNDESSNWSVSNETTVNQTAQIHNLTISRFHDDNSNWSINNNDETIKPVITVHTNNDSKLESSLDYSSKTIDERDHSVWTEPKSGSVSILNKTNDIKNQTIDEFHDQDSNWTVNHEKSVLNETGAKNKTIDEFHDQDSNWTVNHEKSVLNETGAKNKTIDEFHDQDSNWTVNHEKSVLNETGAKNKTVDEFHDQDSNWTVNDQEKTMLNDSVKNQTVDEFHDQDSNWTINKSGELSGFEKLTDEEKKNLSVSCFADQDSDWDKTADKSSSYLSKTINENNASVWQSDINKSIFDASDKKLNRKLNIEEESYEDEKLVYIHTVLGFVMKTNSLEDFYLQTEDADVHLMNMKVELDKCRKVFEKPPQLGTICVAPYHIDKQYYRAQIIEIDKQTNFNNPNTSFNTSINKYNESKVKVLYIDYGNEDIVDINEIFKITLELKNIPPLTLNCRLNLSKKLKEWIKRMSNSNLDVTNDLQKCFIRLTSKSKIKLKVIKETKIEPKNGAATHIRAPPLLVDAFLADENICEHLLVNTMVICQPPINQENELTSLNNKEKDFDGYLINFKPFKKAASSYEISIQNQSVLKLIDDLFQTYNNFSDCSSLNLQENCNGPFSFAPLPKKLIDSYNLKNGYSRVAILDQVARHNLKTDKKPVISHVFVNFVDFDFKCWIEQEDLMMINSYLSQIQSSVEKFNLNLVNINDLNSLNNTQLEHLNEIFKMLIDLKELYKPNDENVLFNWSSKFKTVILNSNKNSNVFSSGVSSNLKITKSSDIKLDSIRLYDTERDMLDINRIIEMCISIMARPFVGHITHIESDFSQFECVNSASVSVYLNELQKLYESTGYFNNNESDEDKKMKKFQVGQLCLVNEISEKPVRVNSCESIVSISGYSNDSVSQEQQQTATTTTVNKKGFFRGVIIDESSEKCVVLNVDNGKRMTLMKKRIQIIDEYNSNKSKLLIRLIPFMLVRARPKSPITDSNLKRILSNSRFYLETIKLNIIGAWCNSDLRTVVDIPLNATEKFNEFIQSEKDLNKIVELLFETSQIKTNSNEQLNEENVIVNKISSISIKNKRKRDDEKIDNAEKTKASELNELDGVYFQLSDMKSLGCFYVHSSDSLKTIDFIEQQIQIEHQENNRLSKQIRKDPKLNTIYGIYSEKQKKYYRVLLKSLISTTTTTTNDLIFNAFYLDYGFSNQINSKDLIFLSEYVQQVAPQAVCCKLNGFSLKPNSSNDDTSVTLSETSEFQAVLCQDQEYKYATEYFMQLLYEKPFMATVSMRYSHFNKIENVLPLQADNYLKPIEVVIHLFEKPISSPISSPVSDLDSQNITYLIKQMISENLKHDDNNADKNLIKKFNIKMHLNNENELVAEFCNLISPNQFYLCLNGFNEKLNEINVQLEHDYKESRLFEADNFSNGSYCVYIDKKKVMYRRARINQLIKNNANIFLIDTGEYVENVNINQLHKLYESYYEREPLCFECTLGLEYTKSNEEKYINKFKSMIQLSKFFRVKLIDEIDEKDKTLFLVNLFGSRATLTETDRSYTMNIGEELKTNSPVLFLQASSPTTKTSFPFLKQTDLKRCCAFKEPEIALNEVLKIQLTNVDTVKHFGIVLSTDIEKRNAFLSNFHLWHKENKRTLKSIFSFKSENNNENAEKKINTACTTTTNTAAYYKSFIGMPCAIMPIQIGKWCRGIIASVDFSAQISSIYLVDHCRTVQVANDRIFKLQEKQFIDEPTYAHRCQLVDEFQQRAKFEKYLDLLKGSVQTNFQTSKDFNSSAEHQQNNENLNSSHISMENIEIQITCLSKTCSQLNQMTNLQNDQYTISVVDFKRIRQTLPVSPFTNIGNTNKPMSKIRVNGHHSIGLSPLIANNNNTKFNYDSTTENVLSSNFKENNGGIGVDLLSISNGNVISSFSKHSTRSVNKANFLNTIENEQSIMNYSGDGSFNNLSAVTESTRITPIDHNDTMQMSNSNTVIDKTVVDNNEYSNGSNTVEKCANIQMNKQKETCKWVKDLDHDDPNFSCINEVEPIGQKIPVRIQSMTTFNPNRFVCEKLELISSLKELQCTMNEYYSKLMNRSSQDNNTNSKQAFVDSLDGEKILQKDERVKFKIGDFCAAKISDTWMRCKIIDIEANKMAVVESIDSYHLQHFQLNKLEYLNLDFNKLPPLALKCRLANLDSTKLLNFNKSSFEKLIKTNNLMLEIISSKEENLTLIYDVDLFADGKNILTS